jgi:hypothetical protein
MKAKLFLITILMTVIPVLSPAQTESAADSAPTNPAGTPESIIPDPGPTNVPFAPESAEPQQRLQENEAAIVAITQNFSATLAGITEAFQQGKMSSERGKTLSAELYLLAQMQFQLFNTWRQMEEQDLNKVPTLVDKSQASPADDNDIVLVELPTFELTAAVEERLSLSQSQKEAIQQVMTRERRHLEPLMAQLRRIGQKLFALEPQHSNKKEIKTLADAEAALLAKFIVANEHMQSEIYGLLTPEQQRKLDDLKRGGESGTVAER